MEIVKRLFNRLARWEYFWLCLLVIVNLVVHFSIINNPSELVLDETYYVSNAREILQEHTTKLREHPPLGKLIIAANMALLGDNPVGWRTFPILFGTANIMLLYLICRELDMSRRAANICVFLLTFENLSFVQGSIAMLDVFNLTFMLLSFWLYLRRHYPFSAVSVALATLVKLTGAFAIFVIFLHWLIDRRDMPVYFMASAALAPLSFLLLMPAFEFVIYHRLVDFISSIKVMLTGSASITFATHSHPHAIRPWEWLIIPKIMPYHYHPNYFGAISFTLWALIIPTVVYMTVLAVRKNRAGLFGALWFAGTYLVWIPMDLITDRLTYVFYFYPTIGAICIGLGMGLSQMIDFWREKTTGKLRWAALIAVLVFLLLHLVVFILLSPLNPWPIENMLFS
ncbi:MAG: phospholipid carrier-dependent glycosyltransferase [Dehalococcoidales bacterium]|nr:phospholipid carrier-dependent glycosyltransferase [Dehalococcoidales bacterium]